MVSQDVNGNGVPDDPWYELSGSADVDSVGKVVYGYEITYTKDAMQDIPWADNQGRSGVVNRNTFHAQEYFPLWLSSPLRFCRVMAMIPAAMEPIGFVMPSGMDMLTM